MSSAILRLALVMAVFIWSATALPGGGEGRLEQGGVLPVNESMGFSEQPDGHHQFEINETRALMVGLREAQVELEEVMELEDRKVRQQVTLIHRLLGFSEETKVSEVKSVDELDLDLREFTAMAVNFFSPSDHQASTATNSFIEMVVGFMTAHGSDAGLQEVGCQVLNTGAVLDHLRYGIRAVAVEGVIEAVLSAMRAHESSAGVQEAGCSALRYLAGNAENWMVIAEKGGIEAVVAAMEAHESIVEVQENGCSALNNFAIRDIHAANAWNKEAATVATWFSASMAARCMQAVMKAMATHRSDVGVKEAGVDALRNLAPAVPSEVRLALMNRASAENERWRLQLRGGY